jgi:hypothetical protein
MCNVGNSFKLHQCKSSAFSRHAESNHRCVHLAARYTPRLFAGLVTLLIAAHETFWCEGLPGNQQPLLQCREQRFSRRLVAEHQIGSHGGDIASHRRSGTLPLPFGSSKLGMLAA